MTGSLKIAYAFWFILSSSALHSSFHSALIPEVLCFPSPFLEPGSLFPSVCLSFCSLSGTCIWVRLYFYYTSAAHVSPTWRNGSTSHLLTDSLMLPACLWHFPLLLNLLMLHFSGLTVDLSELPVNCFPCHLLCCSSGCYVQLTLLSSRLALPYFAGWIPFQVPYSMPDPPQILPALPGGAMQLAITLGEY